MPHVQAIVSRLEGVWSTLPPGTTTVVLDLRDHALDLAHENNALRRNNERLTSVVRKQQERIRELFNAARDAMLANNTAQTMAAHWRLEARGGDYDETKEKTP